MVARKSRPLLHAVAEVVDVALEATVVGSFSRLGFLARRRLCAWEDPPSTLPGGTPGGRAPRAVVTGASSGIGFAVAEALATRGWSVAAVSRDARRATSALERLSAAGAASAGARGSTPPRITGHLADLGDLAEVRRLASELRALTDPGDPDGGIDILVQCAGVLARSFHRTEQGFEATFALHVLGPHLLTGLLTGQPGAGGVGPGGLRPASQVITVSSGGMYAVPLDIGRLERAGPATYRGSTAYALAKRAQVELSVEWARRLEPLAIVPVTMHPGWVATAAISSGLPRFSRLARPILRRPAEGADTVIWLATTPGTGRAGRFYLDRKPRALHPVPGTRPSASQRREAFARVDELVGLARDAGHPPAPAAP